MENIESTRSDRGKKTIRLPIPEPLYGQFILDRSLCHATLEKLFAEHPELFPQGWKQGYALYGRTKPSRKMAGLQMRRARLNSGEIYSIAPSFVMPYMTGRVDESEKPLFLRRFHVPYWAIAYIFGHDAMYWYRMEQGLGRMSLVGTTVQNADDLPNDVLADEKHSRRKGEKCYIATTAAEGCILGASVATSASEVELTQSYGVFASESRDLNPNYQPESVNTDGWSATQSSWKALFPKITIILCFLHAFIKIRDRATKNMKASFDAVCERVWNAYHADNKASFSQQVRRLKEWAELNLMDSPMKSHTLNLCAKRQRFSVAYDHPSAHRTSNMVDRLMRFLDRAFFNAQYFHGTEASAELRVRAIALLWNFSPSSPATIKKHGGQISPAERLNNKRYSDNWLENLLISGSLNGYRRQQNPI